MSTKRRTRRAQSNQDWPEQSLSRYNWPTLVDGALEQLVAIGITIRPTPTSDAKRASDFQPGNLAELAAKLHLIADVLDDYDGDGEGE